MAFDATFWATVALVVFLASPLAGYISGAQVPVDGGAVRIAV